MSGLRTKLTAIIATVVGATGPAIPLTPVKAAGHDAIETCRTILPQIPAQTLGECSSYIITAANHAQGETPHSCDAFEELDTELFYMVFTSKSECIRLMGRPTQKP